MMPCYISHLKVLECGINAFSSQWYGCIFILSYSHLKLTLLLHKQGFVDFQMVTTAIYLLDVHNELLKVRSKAKNYPKNSYRLRKLTRILSDIFCDFLLLLGSSIITAAMQCSAAQLLLPLAARVAAESMHRSQ